MNVATDTYYLTLQENNLNPKIHLTSDFSDVDDTVRFSPVYPVLPEEYVCPDRASTIRYLFFFCSNTYEVISSLSLYIKQRSLFSLGLAGLIITLSDDDSVEDIKHAVGEYNALEEWVVSNGDRKEKNIECKNEVPDKLFSEPLKIAGIQSKDTLNISADINRHLSKLARDAYLYSPELVEIISGVIKFVQYTIDVFVENHSSLKSFEATVRDDEKTSDKNNAKRFLFQSKIDQSSDLLVQLRSSLAYIYSQVFYGTPPVDRNECLLAGYSLLGVGNAVLSLFSLTRFVERTFENYQISKVIGHMYAKNLDYMPPNEALNSENIDSRFSIDKHISDYPAEKIKPSLVFFSTRIGFKETKMTVTAATQTLEAAYSVRWTPFTITHELMHSHVRALLSVIFSPDAGNKQTCSEYMSEQYQGYLLSKKRALHDHEKSELKFINTIQYTIFDFLVEWGQCQSIAENAASDIDLDIKAEDSIAWLKENFSNQYKMLNEIIVHTLDYYYFYNSNEALFLGSLWGSWTTVPGVSKHISEYILRSIVAISVDHDGDEMARFNSAVAKLEGVLENLCQNKDSKTLAMMALSFLGDKKDRLQKLKIKFAFCDTIARMARKYFICESALAGIEDSDTRITVNDDSNHEYHLDSGYFTGNINNPVILSKVLLSRSIDNLINSHDLDRSENYLSAWHLLAVASGITETKPFREVPLV